jgi:hypothetical protein
MKIVLPFSVFIAIITLGVSITEAATINVSWVIRKYNPLTINLGDTVVFSFSPNHNVYQTPTSTCSMQGAKEVSFNG